MIPRLSESINMFMRTLANWIKSLQSEYKSAIWLRYTDKVISAVQDVR